MLSLFRGSGFSQVLVGGIAFSIILVFALEFRAGKNGPTASLKKECVLEIKGSCLDPKEYNAAYGLIAGRFVDPHLSRQIGLRKKVLDGLVERELLVGEAQRLGISVSKDEVESELLAGRAHVSLPAAEADKLSYRLGLCRLAEDRGSCEQGGDTLVRGLRVKRTPEEPFDYALYEREVRILANRGPAEFKDMQVHELTAARMRTLIREPVRVPEAEAFAIFSQSRTTATVRSVVLQRDWFAKYLIDLSPAALDKWSADNKAAIDTGWEAEKANFSAGCVPTREIVLEIGPGANDQDRADTRKKLQAARERVSAGESFANVARSVSAGQTATTGGELGCIGASYGVGNEEVVKAAAALKPGELSQIIETPRGLHLLEVDAKLDATNLEAYGKRFVARRSYVQASADAQLKSFGEELIKRVKAGAKLEDALNAQLAVTLPASVKKPSEEQAPAVPALAATDRPKVDISSPFNSSGNPLPQITPKEPLAAHAFDLKNPDDIWPSLIATTDGAVVMQLKAKDPASREEFDKNKAALINARTEQKASEALNNYVSELRRSVGDKLKVDPRFSEEPKSSDRNDDE
ncbi:MAG: peptidylprolyl isomerase [Pseudomonadota bacterium]